MSRLPVRHPAGHARFGARVVVCAGLLWCSTALAQDAASPNPLVRLDLGTGLRIDDDETQLRNTVGLTYATRTRTDALTFSLGSALDVTEDGVDTDDILPSLTLSYTRDTGVLLLGIGVDYDVDDVDSTIPGPDFDFDSTDLINDDGQVETLGLTFNAELWRTAPAGLELGATYDARTYSGTSDPSFDDTETGYYRVALRLQPNPGLIFRPFVERTEYRDTGETPSDTTTTQTGLQVTWAATPTTGVELSLGRTDARETRDATVVGLVDGVPALVSTGQREVIESSGLSFEGTLVRALPNGTIGLNVSHEIETEGNILDIRGTRSLELANGATFDVALGAADVEDDGTYLVGSLRYAKPLARGGQLSFSASRDADYDSDEQTVLRSRASLSHSRPLTPNSTLTANLGVARIDVVDGFEADEDAVTYGVNYNRALTRDWALDVSYQGTETRIDGLSPTTDNLFSLNVSRSFTFRP